LLDEGRMKRVFISIAVALVAWVSASSIFELPPLYHYVGESGNACLNNLRQIDGAKQQWALEKGKTNGSTVTVADIAPYIRDGTLRCPSGGSYRIGTLEENPTCSYGTNDPPPGQKERVGLFGWRWNIWPSSIGSHRLPQ
jgi:hypothetical protein